jgi:hypothetical protein
MQHSNDASGEYYENATDLKLLDIAREQCAPVAPENGISLVR